MQVCSSCNVQMVKNLCSSSPLLALLMYTWDTHLFNLHTHMRANRCALRLIMHISRWLASVLTKRVSLLLILVPYRIGSDLLLHRNHHTQPISYRYTFVAARLILTGYLILSTHLTAVLEGECKDGSSRK